MSSATPELQSVLSDLPGLDCGLCGRRSCAEFAKAVVERPGEIRRCIYKDGAGRGARPAAKSAAPVAWAAPDVQASACAGSCVACDMGDVHEGVTYEDSLGRDFDFVLDTFPNEPGPRETMLPHNPLITREMNVTRGDLIIGRPLGMSCGCPITHCGVVMSVEPRTGVIVWCVTGPLNPRASAHKDIGYYSAEAYEGLVKDTRAELKIGMRYWFMPRRCMLQWRHSGLVNSISKGKHGVQVRIEGLYIG
ncbi:MAG TPA: (Fe-S)-binding protein [Phycisphaerae bacterium]|nr:(Fe-S)-binding protein [Phycisphaerae bacterium]HRY69719.1 (Fe-S)-binding protein [Phycisphaerae bacterium]HSA25084.1 (Fe-S)-binding protein [Phycisphaerae bacterium]